MRIDGYVQAVQEDLARAAALGDESTARAAELLGLALESSLLRRIQEALAEAALEASAQLEQGRLEVRVAGTDPELVYVNEVPVRPPDVNDASFDARITLRLPESLKSRLESAAAAEGVSVNTWVVQALSRAPAQRSSTGGGRRRLTGYGHS